jgi:hypothetical protein
MIFIHIMAHMEVFLLALPDLCVETAARASPALNVWLLGKVKQPHCVAFLVLFFL